MADHAEDAHSGSKAAGPVDSARPGRARPRRAAARAAARPRRSRSRPGLGRDRRPPGQAQQTGSPPSSTRATPATRPMRRTSCRTPSPPPTCRRPCVRASRQVAGGPGKRGQLPAASAAARAREEAEEAEDDEQQGEQQQGDHHGGRPRPQATRPRRHAPSRPGQAQGGARMNQHLGGERYELEHRLGHGGMATVYLRPRPEARPRGRDQAARRQLRRGRRGPQALLARGPARGPARPPERGPGLRRRRGGRTAPTSSWSTSTAAPSRTASNGRTTVDGAGRGTAPARPALRRARPRARQEARPPRHQAPEPAPARVGRLPEDHRLRDRAGRGGDHAPDAGRAR